VPSDRANEQADLQNRDAAGVQLTSAHAPAFCQTIALLANSLVNWRYAGDDREVSG